MNISATAHITRVDPILRRLVDSVGPPQLRSNPRRTPFEGLVRAIAHQQLTGAAASTILDRFTALFPGRKFPSPQDVAGIYTSRLVRSGFSHAKARYIKGIAAAALNGRLPEHRELSMLSDEEIIRSLTRLKGVGLWSAQMYLIFGLGRPDVLPSDDFGLRRGFAIVFRKRNLPTPNELIKRGDRWRPFRSTASWYLWRAADLASGKALSLKF